MGQRLLTIGSKVRVLLGSPITCNKLQTRNDGPSGPTFFLLHHWCNKMKGSVCGQVVRRRPSGVNRFVVETPYNEPVPSESCHRSQTRTRNAPSRKGGFCFGHLGGLDNRSRQIHIHVDAKAARSPSHAPCPCRARRSGCVRVSCCRWRCALVLQA